MISDMGESIRIARKKKGLTQLELSTLSGLEGSTVRHYELGRRTPSDTVLERIAEALGVSVESLMNLSPSTDREALEMLFRLEAKYRCHPQASEGSFTVSFDDASDEFKAMLQTWADERSKLDRREITAVEYMEWRSAYRG